MSNQVAVGRDGQANGDVSRHILPTSSGMVGVSITIVGLVRLLETTTMMVTIIDDWAAIASVLFLVSALLSYLAIRSQTLSRFEWVADVFFLVGLTMLVGCGVMLAWEVGQLTPIASARMSTATCPCP